MNSPATKDDLFRRFERLGIAVKTHEHEAAFTVEQARSHRGNIPGCHCKNLFLKDKKGQLWLVVCREEAIVDLKSLPKTIGSARLSFGKPDLLMDVLGIEPGSVTPFALVNDTQNRVKVVLDAKMMDNAIVNYHPLVNTATSSITPEDLLRFIKDCGHTPEVTAIGD